MRLAESHEPFRSTEIGEFPESWDVLPLGTLFDLQQGKALSPSARMGASPRPFLRTANVLWSRLDLETLDRMDFSPEETERLSLRSGDLLVCEGGEIGRTALWRGEVEDCSYQNHVHRLRAKTPDVVPEFVMYWMQAAFIRLGLYGGVGNRTTIPNLSGARLKQLPLPLPSVSEQQAIAQILSRLQAAVEMQEKIVATLKELKAATMAKLFREGLRGRTDGIVPTRFGDVPGDWRIAPLAEHAQVQTGAAKGRDLGDSDTVEVPYLRVANVQDGYLDLSEIKTIRIRERELERYSLRPGDVLLTEGGDFDKLGRGYLWSGAVPRCVHQNYIFAVRTDPRTLLPEFFAYLVQSPYGKGYFLTVAHKTTNLACINSTKLKAFPLVLPDLGEQREINDVLRNIDDALDSHARRLDALKAMFATTLTLLMTGQLRVTGSERIGGGSEVNRPEMERFVEELVWRFDPDRVILFGPPATGSPRAFGAVGLLVEMPFLGLARDQAAWIAREIPHDFSLDLLVRRPEELRRAREIGDRYLGGILDRGRVLHARPPGAPARQPAEAEAPRRPPQAFSEETLQELVRQIVEAVQPEQIVLFGSAARGEMGPDSDVDLLVVKSCTDRRAVAQTIREHLLGVARGLPKDIIVVTPEDVERDRDTIGYIIRPALREGRMVYAA